MGHNGFSGHRTRVKVWLGNCLMNG